MSNDQLDQVRKIIKDNPTLIWYSQNFDSLNEEALVEAILNNGSWQEVDKLNHTLGNEVVGDIFMKLNSSKRSNFHPLVSNFFSAYYARHTS